METNKKLEKIRYRSYSFRLNDKTWERLKEMKKESGKSWNLFIFLLVNLNEKYAKQNRTKN
jgi:predicted DNA-binding protein